jgi:hypothetical protein
MDHSCLMCGVVNHLDQAAPAPHVERAGAVRHLLFHLYPVGEWKWHAAQIRRRASLFNGRRVVAAALGPETASLGEVRDELDGLGVELVPVRNDPDLKEMAAYPELLETVKDFASPADCHLYAHSKGVVSQRSIGPGARRWAEAMWEALADHWPAVARSLQGHAAVGIFRRLWEGPIKTLARWHFSGSFRWVRNADLFRRDWRRMDRTWLGSETHVGLVFGRGESDCLFGEFSTQDCGLYAEAEWERWAEPQRRAWLAEHAEDRVEPVLATVILTSARQPDLVHEAVASVFGQTTDSWQLLIVDAGELAASGAFDRYKTDARVSVFTTGEDEELRGRVAIQGWAINEAWRRGRALGDLVFHLSDDDAFHSGWLASVIERSRTHPHESAWYGRALRERIGPGGERYVLPPLGLVGPGTPANPLRCRVDGMQAACRRSARVDWTERRELAEHADGWWIDALAANHTVHPLDALAGVHRHTPASTFTR